MRLTKAEEQVMKILWELEEATVQCILNKIENNKPARTTISTVLNVLEKKGFVEHTTKGHVNFYKAVLEKNIYSKKQMSDFVRDYFNGSYSSLFAFFAKESNLTIEEMDKILKEQQEIKRRKEKK